MAIHEKSSVVTKLFAKIFNKIGILLKKNDNSLKIASLHESAARSLKQVLVSFRECLA